MSWVNRITEFSALASHRVQHRRSRTPHTLLQTAEIGGVSHPVNMSPLGLVRGNCILCPMGTEWLKKTAMPSHTQKVKIQEFSEGRRIWRFIRAATKSPIRTVSKLFPFKWRGKKPPLAFIFKMGWKRGRTHIWTLKVSDIPIHKSFQGEAVTVHLLLCPLNGLDPNITFSSG